MSNDDYNKILNEWYHAKEQSKKYEDLCEKYKSQINKIMIKNNKNSLTTDKYKVSKRSQIVSRISKSSVPEDIWEKYSTSTMFDVFTLKKI